MTLHKVAAAFSCGLLLFSLPAYSQTEDRSVRPFKTQVPQAALEDLRRRINATALAYRGEADGAFQWLEKAAKYREPVFGSITLYPMLANLHSDPRWLPFLRKYGMAPEQLAAIKFDVKVPR